jgi:hypothetical protein
MNADDFLEHYGVKGMKWGVRKDRPGGASRRVDRDASKDAKEFAAAKAFYGTGAGTRRKLIKQTVEGKSKRLPGYKEAFDHHLSNQDTSKHATKAVSKRKRVDRADKTKKTVGAIARSKTGEAGTQAAFTMLALGGAAYLNSPRGKAAMKGAASKVGNVANEARRKAGAKQVNKLLKDMGL